MVRYHITPLEIDEIKDYINHRLNIAGSADRIRFTDEAIGIISNFSSGVPRLINMVCDRALLAGFVAETNIIDLNIIKKCVEELDNYYVAK
jgi:general secretion pathway protein A